MIDVHARLIRRLEQVADLKRELEFLPSEDEISDRRAAHQGLVSPELAIVMAYAKIFLFGRLLESDLPDDEDLFGEEKRYFPPPLPERYARPMREHRLRREIVATALANQVVERVGTTFAFRLADEIDASPVLLARGYAVAREVFEMRSFWDAVQGLDNEVEAQIQLEMLIEGRRLVERATRWLAENHAGPIRIAETARRFEPGARLLAESLPDVLDDAGRERFEDGVARLRDAGVPSWLAARVASMRSLPAAFDIVAVATEVGAELRLVMDVHFGLGARLEVSWLRERITELPRTNRWESLTRSALRSDLAAIQRSLTAEVLSNAPERAGAEQAIDAWWESHEEAIRRWLATAADIRAARIYATTTLPVALRELRALVS
jgi:glutamate dehydrogenase